MKNVYALARSLRDRQLPRNRHFAEHDTPAGAAARRLVRFLRAVERDLLQASDVALKAERGSFVLTMSFPSVRLTRVVSLTPEERDLLEEEPRAREILRRATS